MCAVETELDDTRHPEHCAQPWTKESWMECQAFMGGKLKIKGNVVFATLTLSAVSADPLSTTQMILCHQESQREPH